MGSNSAFKVLIHCNRSISNMHNIPKYVSRHKMQQTLFRLTNASGGLNERSFQRLAPSLSSGFWHGDGASLPNVAGFEPPVAFVRFFEFCKTSYTQVVRLFLWIIPSPHPPRRRTY